MSSDCSARLQSLVDDPKRAADFLLHIGYPDDEVARALAAHFDVNLNRARGLVRATQRRLADEA